MLLQFVRSCQPDRREKNSGWLFGRRLRQSPSISSRLELPCQIWKRLETFGDIWRHHQISRGGEQVDTTHKWRYDDQGIRFDCLVIVGVRQFEHFLLLTSFDNAPSNQARVCHRNMSWTFLFACVVTHCNSMSHTGIASLRKSTFIKSKCWNHKKLPPSASKTNFKT